MLSAIFDLSFYFSLFDLATLLIALVASVFLVASVAPVALATLVSVVLDSSNKSVLPSARSEFIAFKCSIETKLRVSIRSLSSSGSGLIFPSFVYLMRFLDMSFAALVISLVTAALFVLIAFLSSYSVLVLS